MRHRLLRGALRGPRGRALLAAAGVGASALLVVVMLAAYRSLQQCVAAYVGQAGCDLWIAPPGTDNLIRSGGFLPVEWRERARVTPGVEAVEPLLRTFLRVERTRGDAVALTLLAIGHEAAGLGGPPRLASGRAAEGGGEIVLDRAAAFRLNVQAGDTVRVNGEVRRIAGLSGGTNLIATQFVFADHSHLQRGLGLDGRTSFLVVRLRPGAAVALVARDLAARLPGASILTKEEFVTHNRREVAAGFLPLLALLAVLSLAVTVTLVALLVQALVDGRRADIAVVMAMGASARAVAAAILAGVGVVIGAGAVAGAAASRLLGVLLDRVQPTIELTYHAQDALLVLALFTLAGLVAGALPVARLRRLDALEAFRP